MAGAIRHALAVADMEDDVYQLGLRRQLDPAARPEAAARLLEARRVLERRLKEDAYRGLVEPFERGAYCANATVGENLLFGTPIGDAFDLDRLPENAYVMKILGDAGLDRDFLEIGIEVARTMVELFADLPPDHEYFEQFSFISLDDLPNFRASLQKVGHEGPAGLDDAERLRFLALPFRLSPARHRLGLIDERMQALILEARGTFADRLPDALQGSVAFFDRNRYNAALSLQDNILFGKLAYGRAQAQAKIGELMADVIAHHDLRPVAIELGLEFEVGIGGSRLSQAQRQKLAIARAVLKRPCVIVLGEATAPLDGAAQARVLANLIEEFRGRAVIWALQRPSQAEAFDEVCVMKAGKIVERGSYDALMARRSALAELVATA